MSRGLSHRPEPETLEQRNILQVSKIFKFGVMRMRVSIDICWFGLCFFLKLRQGEEVQQARKDARRSIGVSSRFEARAEVLTEDSVINHQRELKTVR